MIRRKTVAVALVGILGIVVVTAGLFHRPLLSWLFVRYLEYRAGHFDPRGQSWVECSIPLPDASYGATFLQRNVHPFLTEYDYAVRFRTPGLAETERPLPTNTGGRTAMNVYWYPPTTATGPFLRLQDKDGEYLVDFKGGKTRRLLRLRGSTYAGDLIGDVNSYGISESARELRVHVGNQIAERVTEIYTTEAGIYLGRLEGRETPPQFLDAAREPEKTIILRRSFE